MQVRTEAIVSLDVQQCQAGNMTSVHPLHVYQKTRSEVLSRNDISKDSVKDLQQRAKVERENGEIFIQHIATLPFSVILFCENNFKILHQALKNNKNMQAYLDATGGIVRRISDSNLLNHCLVFPIKSNMVNRSNNVLVLAELISEDNCSYNIENFLRLVKTKFQHLFKNERMFRSIVTDKSYANINAIIQSQNSITFLNYLKTMYEVRTDHIKLQNITLVFLCSSHLAKVWKSDIQKWFKHLDKEDIFLLCGLIGNTVNIRRYKDLKKYLQNLIKLFLHKKADSEYWFTLQQLKEAFNNEDDWIYQINAEDGDKQETISNKETQQTDHEFSNVIYKQSPFFMEFKEYMDDLKLSRLPEEEDECDELNVFFSPGFIKHFLKNSIPILPLWSAVYFSKGFEEDDELHRPNNGFVEGYFSSLKNSFRTNLSWGKLGSVKIGRYVEAMKQKNQYALKEIELKIPNKHMVRKQKDTSLTSADLSVEIENWKGKSKKSSTIMFNRENLIRNLGKILFYNFNYQLIKYFFISRLKVIESKEMMDYKLTKIQKY